MNNIEKCTSGKQYSLIIDIGKTHVKLHVLNSILESVYSRQMTNTVNLEDIYPSANIGKLWQWLCENIQVLTAEYCIAKMTITTHGATAALIDRESSKTDGLVLPILDYEHTAVFDETPDYQAFRPDFEETYSPSLPAGLNLGRQLFWLKKNYPQQFSQATDILMYPQYWAWRFTGQRFSEITSLGCHTDLWSVRHNDYSKLVKKLECTDMFPELQPAWQNCGKVHTELCESLGLDQDCQFFSGLHDSNASFLRYRLANGDKPFIVISTGTWTILMASQVKLSNLSANKDMLANVDALSTPIACARFMGGREFELICEQAGSWLGEQFDVLSLQGVIDQGVFALPDFSGGSGPFGGQASSILGAVDKVSGIALATLYCALMIDYQLNTLQAKGNVIIEGAFLKNPLLCATLGQLRPEQKILLSKDATGTVVGAGYLMDWGNLDTNVELSESKPIKLNGLDDYRKKWLRLVEH